MNQTNSDREENIFHVKKAEPNPCDSLTSKIKAKGFDDISHPQSG